MLKELESGHEIFLSSNFSKNQNKSITYSRDCDNSIENKLNKIMKLNSQTNLILKDQIEKIKN
jgi:ubiquinone biosynthesis protein COQ9